MSQNVLFLIEKGLENYLWPWASNPVLGSAHDKFVQVNCKLIYTL